MRFFYYGLGDMLLMWKNYDIIWNVRAWRWWPSFHCTGCCWFHFWWGPISIGIARVKHP